MIIATRMLILRGEAGDAEIPIRIHALEQDDRCWKCRYAVEWPGGKFESEAYGEDAVQAIVLAFEKIGVELYVSDEHKSGKLGWGEPGNGYGFPVAKTVRDLLVGYDKQFFAS
jgi:hypothetical protein